MQEYLNNIDINDQDQCQDSRCATFPHTDIFFYINVTKLTSRAWPVFKKPISSSDLSSLLTSNLNPPVNPVDLNLSPLPA
jgi:hypothetical protein